MRYRKLSLTGDYTFGSGQLDFLRDTPETVAQAVKTSLLLWVGEWYLNIEEGTPYMQGILGKHDQELAEITLQDRITQVQGVTGIESFSASLDRETRRMSVSATINTLYGVTKLQVQNYANY